MSAETPRRPRAIKPTPNVGTAKKRDADASPRPPRAATLDAIAEGTLVAVPDAAAQRTGLDAEAAADALTPPVPPARRRRFGWLKLFIAAVTGLVTLAVGLWFDGLVRSLFARQDYLGWLAIGLVALAALAALAIVLREIWALSRMAKIDSLRVRAAKAWRDDDMKAGRAVARDVSALYDDRPELSAALKELAQHRREIVDGRDLVTLIERDVMTGLDRNARALVMGSAQRVSVVTAVSPRAIVDLAFVLMENMKLIRRIADLYGGRPGTIGFWRLTGNVLSHLAVTGSIAIGDGLLQQVVGHGVAAKISTRLGEGVVNGLLTARIGIAAIDVCRPLPFTAMTRPKIGDFLAQIMQSGGVADRSQNGGER